MTLYHQQLVNAPKYLICAHQTKDSIDSPNKNKSNAIFDRLHFRKLYVEIDSQRYPRDSLLINIKKMIILNNIKI